MNYIQIFLKEFYEYNKKEFWLLIAGNIALGIAINYIPLHEFLQAGVVVIMALKNFTFLRSASVMPSISSDFDRYSWKYFQGLPLSKRELIITLVLSNLFVIFPLVMWLMSFYVQIAGLFTDENTKLILEVPVKLFLALIPILLIISTNALSNQIQFPRRQYSKIEPRTRFLHSLKIGAIAIAALIYGWFAYEFLSALLKFQVGPYFVETLKIVWWIIKSWWLSPVLFVLAYLNYKATLTIWQDEKRSYSNIKWNPRSDIPITAFALMLVAIPVMRVDWQLPAKYDGNELLAATFHRDLKQIKDLVKSGFDINSSNQNGYTAIMVAAREGDKKIFEILKSHGASTKGKTKNLKDDNKEGADILYLAIKGKNITIIQHLLAEGFSPNADFERENFSTPLHLASSFCSQEVVDLLIEKKANLNAINKLGETALHIAARNHCFGVVTSLMDAGIDYSIKNKMDKLAIENIKDSNHTKDLKYYLEKKSRSPASKK